jgi:hypothetical protein
MEEEAADVPSADAVASVNAQIAAVNKKIEALVEEISTLSE